MNTPKTRTPSMTLLDVEVALREREKKGVEVYGQTVDRTDFSALEWAYEGLNEALDGAIYSMRTIKAIERLERRESLMREALGKIAVGADVAWELKAIASNAIHDLSKEDNE